MNKCHFLQKTPGKFEKPSSAPFPSLQPRIKNNPACANVAFTHDGSGNHFA